MSNEKISDFTEVTTSGLADVVPCLQSGNKKTTLQKIRDLFANHFAATTTVNSALAGKADKVDGRLPAAQLPDGISGWSSNVGVEARAGFNSDSFTNPETQQLAQYMAGLIRDLKTYGVIKD